MAKLMSFLQRDGIQVLLDRLHEDGRCVIGPQWRDGAIVYDKLQSLAQMPRGITDEQAPGLYRTHQGNHDRLFAWANGPQGIKPWLFRPRESLWHCEKGPDGKLRFVAAEPESMPLAIIGARACDIAALYIHDSHFLQGEYKDPAYRLRRQDLLIVAVNCTHPAATCFCASTGDGPEVRFGYDLALTELDDGFTITAHSPKGKTLLTRLPTTPATRQQCAQAAQAIKQAAAGQRRHLPSTDVRDKLFARLDHPQWDDIARRCLSCGNCTAVCPTCFCHSEHDEGGLDTSRTEHVRQWDSCFDQQHSYIHGLTIRPDTRSRYRQWLTHKLAGWHDQFGRSGCVGCGRCITWCPVGIDITAETALICGEVLHA